MLFFSKIDPQFQTEDEINLADNISVTKSDKISIAEPGYEKAESSRKSSINGAIRG